jgi:hypothetical protein
MRFSKLRFRPPGAPRFAEKTNLLDETIQIGCRLEVFSTPARWSIKAAF